MPLVVGSVVGAEQNGAASLSFAGTLYGAAPPEVTVGAENKFGNSGENRYVDGVGTPVSAGSEVRVVSAPGAPGETYTITYTATGEDTGGWTNCAEMTSDLFFGTNIACFSGEVIGP